MAGLVLKKEVFEIVGAAIEVHRQLGPGFLEAVYQEALGLEMDSRAIPFQAQKPLRIRYKGRVLDKAYFADFLCYGKVIVEIKALDHLSGNEYAQVLNYLKATGHRVGLLINFGSHPKLQWKRFIH